MKLPMSVIDSLRSLEIAEPRSRELKRRFFRVPLDRVLLSGMGFALLFGFLVFLLGPLFILLTKSVLNEAGQFVGFENFYLYFSTPGLSTSFFNSLFVATVSAALSVGLALGFSMALGRVSKPVEIGLRGVALIPLATPSFLLALSLVYLFGRQGFAKHFLFGYSIYGPLGIVIGETFFCLPHAFLLVDTALGKINASSLEAARTLGAGSLRRLATIIWPQVRLAMVQAFLLCFTLAITDFGIPKVIGGSYDVLATDLYQHVIGQQKFNLGAVVAAFLLVPGVLSFVLTWLQRSSSLVTSMPMRSRMMTSFAGQFASYAVLGAVGLSVLGLLAVAVFASFARFWPYDLSLSLQHYYFNASEGARWEAFQNSLYIACSTVGVGTVLIIVSATIVARSRIANSIRYSLRFVAMLPAAIPGLALGLSYIFFFNNPGNPLRSWYLTFPLLVMSVVMHSLTTPFLTFESRLRGIGRDLDEAAIVLNTPPRRFFWTVTLPHCVPVIWEVALYFFVTALTTVSTVVFLAAPGFSIASLAVLNLEDIGDSASAAAMAVLIMVPGLVVHLLRVFKRSGLHRL